MLIFVVNDRLYGVNDDELSHRPLRALVRFSTFFISVDAESQFSWVLNKNRHNGESLVFMSYQDVLFYIRGVQPTLQKHNGLLPLRDSNSVSELLSRLFPLFSGL